MGWPSVGVVLPTHHRPGPLRIALAAVLAQDYPGRLCAVVVYDRAEPDLRLADGDRVRVAVNARTPGLAGIPCVAKPEPACFNAVLALLGAVKSVNPDVKFLTAVGQAQRGIVSNVIAGAHEGVDGAQRFALAARQGEKRIIEVLGRRAGNALAYRIRHDELGWSRGPGTGNLLRARAHGFPPSFCSTVPRSFLLAARATSESLRGLEMDGRFPRTA